MGKTVSSDTRPNTSLPPDKVSNMKHRTKQDRLPPVRLITFKLIALCIVSARRLLVCDEGGDQSFLGD